MFTLTNKTTINGDNNKNQNLEDLFKLKLSCKELQSIINLIEKCVKETNFMLKLKFNLERSDGINVSFFLHIVFFIIIVYFLNNFFVSQKIHEYIDSLFDINVKKIDELQVDFEYFVVKQFLFNIIDENDKNELCNKLLKIKHLNSNKNIVNDIVGIIYFTFVFFIMQLN